MSDPYDRIFQDLADLEKRVKALRSGDTLAEAQANLEQRFDRLEHAFIELRRDFDKAPEQWASAVIAEIKKQGNVRFERTAP